VGDLNDKLASISEGSKARDGQRKAILALSYCSFDHSILRLILTTSIRLFYDNVALQLEYRDETRDSGTCMHTFHGHDGVVTSLDLNGPYGTLVTASRDNTTRVWDLSTFKCLGQLPGHEDTVECLQLTQHTLVTGSRDNTIRTWNLADLSHNQHSRSPSPTPSDSSYSSNHINGKFTDTDGDDYSRSSREVISVLDNCWTGTLTGHTGNVTCLYFEDDKLVSVQSTSICGLKKVPIDDAFVDLTCPIFCRSCSSLDQTTRLLRSGILRLVNVS
jgi:division protein 1